VRSATIPSKQRRLLADPLVRFCLDHLTSAEQRALESDLSLAARIQRALLRSSVWRPQAGAFATTINPRDGERPITATSLKQKAACSLVIGDVAGKGVAASMLMSHLHATFRQPRRAGLPLDRMVEDANRIFCESTFAGQFATLVVGRATRDGSVEFVSAGISLCFISTVTERHRGFHGVPLGMFCKLDSCASTHAVSG